MNDKIVRELARDVLDYADRKDYGLGECMWNLNHFALETVENCDAYMGFDDAYDKKDHDCTGDHAAHLKLAKQRARDAYAFACELQNRGVRTFA